MTEVKTPKNGIIINFFNNIILVIFSIFYYAFIGLKACTYDLLKALFKSLTSVKQKDSLKKRQELNKEHEKLMADLKASGATRNKEVKTYYYKVQDSNGKIITGYINGLSKLDINAFLVNEGYTVYSIKTNSLINFFFNNMSYGHRKMSTKELVFFLTQLKTYLKAGLTLNDSLKILIKQMAKDKSRQRALQSILYEITLGSSFSKALENLGGMFPSFLINMLKAAEASGTLVDTLEDMASYYTEIDETKKQMVSAMIYPTIVTIFALGVIVFILVYIIPNFVDIYSENNIEINAFTNFIINASIFLKANIWLILGIIVAVIIVISVAYKNMSSFRKSVQVFLMHLPVIKNIIIYNELAIFSKTFASLLKNNVFITDTINILSKITNNEVYKEILSKTVNNIAKGEKISEAFKNHWAVPEVAYFMMVTGESTGDLAEMLDKVSNYYQGMHRNIVNNLKSLIEPILIVILAIVVGAIIIAVIVPMFGMYGELM